MLNIILIVGFGALINACLTYFLDFCFEEGHIFEKWLPFVAKIIGENNFFYKPLGGCPTCSNIWTGFIAWPIYALVTGLSWVVILKWYLPYLLISNFLIRKIL